MDPDFYYRRPPQLPPTTPQERDLSWRCEVCGYHVLSIDQAGKGLPLEAGPSGEIIPLQCPRCRQEHRHWTPVSPFDAFGDHANLPSALSSRVTHGASIFEQVHREMLHFRSHSQQSNRGSTAVTPKQQNLNNSSSPEQLMSSSGQSQSSSQQYAPIQRESHYNFTNNNNAVGSLTPGAMPIGAAGSPSSVMTVNLANSVPQQQLERDPMRKSILSSSNHTHNSGAMVVRSGVVSALGGLMGVGSEYGGGGVSNRNGGGGTIGTSFEYEYLADHEALKDPDVIEALQRLRQRRGAYNTHHQNQQQHAPASSNFSERYVTGNNNEYSSFYTGGAAMNRSSGKEVLLTDEQIARLPESSLQRAAAHRNTTPRALECYVCGVCNRRLLRIDHKGELIPIESDAQGKLAELECPGCHQTHSRWLRVMLNNTTSAPMPGSASGSLNYSPPHHSNNNIQQNSPQQQQNNSQTTTTNANTSTTQSNNPAMTMTGFASPSTMMGRR